MGGEKCAPASILPFSLGSPPHGRGKALYCVFEGLVGGDHPRMGGEKVTVFLVSLWTLGSPPHGRGKVSSVSMCTRSPGITPAWAGKSPPAGGLLSGPQDHPRMGGEKTVSSCRFILGQGSPPHGRGKVCSCFHFAVLVGITPAWAGKRWFRLIFCHLLQDHPRMGGEKCVCIVWVDAQRGSPPHGRGKADNPPTTEKKGGITPAWAGKRSPVRQLFYLQ